MQFLRSHTLTHTTHTHTHTHFSDVIQVWSSQDNLKTILANTTSQIIVSWYENVYMDCGNGNMFGDE